jgi:hypothetical protein
MPCNMGRPAFTFINLYIFCNLQRIINKNIHLGYVCIYFLTYMYIDLLIDVDNVVRFVIVRFGTLAAILSNR